MKAWSNNAETETGFFTELEQRNCSMTEFNGVHSVDNDDLDFFVPAKSALADIEIYGSKMRCLKDENDIMLWGNYNSPDSSNLMVVFDKCDNATSRVKCKSDEEINNWM